MNEHVQAFAPYGHAEFLAREDLDHQLAYVIEYATHARALLEMGGRNSDELDVAMRFMATRVREALSSFKDMRTRRAAA